MFKKAKRTDIPSLLADITCECGPYTDLCDKRKTHFKARAALEKWASGYLVKGMEAEFLNFGNGARVQVNIEPDLKLKAKHAEKFLAMHRDMDPEGISEKRAHVKLLLTRMVTKKVEVSKTYTTLEIYGWRYANLLTGADTHGSRSIKDNHHGPYADMWDLFLLESV